MRTFCKFSHQPFAHQWFLLPACLLYVQPDYGYVGIVFLRHSWAIIWRRGGQYTESDVVPFPGFRLGKCVIVFGGFSDDVWLLTPTICLCLHERLRSLQCIFGRIGLGCKRRPGK